MGIKPATFWHVAKSLNHVPACPIEILTGLMLERMEMMKMK
jgi:predicted outer membrane lipoprotein